jgi:hypothetical protein
MLLVVLASSLCLLGSASAEIIFKGDFETGDFSQFGGKKMTVKKEEPLKFGLSEYQNFNERNVQLVTDFVANGKYAVKMTIHPEDKFGKGQLRVQLGGPYVRFDEGTHTYMSFYLAMKDPPKSRDNFFYWEGDKLTGSGGNVMTWWLEPKQDGSGTLIKYGTGNLGKSGVHWEADFTIGKWHQMAMDITWSADPEKGNAKLWYDGNVVLDKKVKTRASDKMTGAYCQPGIQRGNPMDLGVDTIYMDDFICATTLPEINIMKPAPAK